MTLALVLVGALWLTAVALAHREWFSRVPPGRNCVVVFPRGWCVERLWGWHWGRFDNTWTVAERFGNRAVSFGCLVVYRSPMVDAP